MVSSRFCIGKSNGCHFAQSLSYCWIVKSTCGDKDFEDASGSQDKTSRDTSLSSKPVKIGGVISSEYGTGLIVMAD